VDIPVISIMDWTIGKDYVEFAFGLTGSQTLNTRVKPWEEKAYQKKGGGEGGTPVPPVHLQDQHLETPLTGDREDRDEPPRPQHTFHRDRARISEFSLHRRVVLLREGDHGV